MSNNPNFGKKPKNQQKMMLDMMAMRGGFHHGGMMGYGGMGMQLMGQEDPFMSTSSMIHNKFKENLKMMSPPFPEDMDDDYDDRIV